MTQKDTTAAFSCSENINASDLAKMMSTFDPKNGTATIQDPLTTPALLIPLDTEISPPKSSGPARDLEACGMQNLQRTASEPSPYYSLALWRKSLVVFATSFTALSVTFSSTSLFIATNEISEAINTTANTIQVVNSLVVFVMGCSGFFWGPIGRLFGRRYAWLAACCMFVLCTIGTGLAPDGNGLSTFTAMRIISGLEGSSFHTMGQTWLADIFEPVSFLPVSTLPILRGSVLNIVV